MHELHLAGDLERSREDESHVAHRHGHGVAIDEDQAETLFRLFEILDDSDDVQRVVANFEVDDAVLERLAA